MRIQLKKILGLERGHPDILFFLDCINLRNSRVLSLIIMVMEIIMFSISFGFQVHEEIVSPHRWLFHHRVAYVILFLSALQLFLYTATHSPQRGMFDHFKLNASILLFVMTIAVFGIYISILDYILGEQIFVFISLELLISCVFIVRPLFSVALITVSFALFYFLMDTTKGISSATDINYPILLVFFLIVNVTIYRQYYRIAAQTVMNHALAEKLREASLTDSLTRLKNRSALKLNFDKFIGRQVTLMLTDIDNFKSHNDTRGHNYGDELLVRFAKILQETFGEENCYRYGGDEYIVMIPKMDKEDFLAKIESCKAAANDEFHFSGGFFSASATPQTNLHAFINKADEKLYQAKREGKNRVLGE